MKKQPKKLSLHKETISNLSRQEMSLIRGGGFLSLFGNSCQQSKCPERCTFIGSEVEPCTHSENGESCMTNTCQ